MASITKTTTKATKTKKAESRYVLRYRVKGRAVEEWFGTKAEATAIKTTVEADELNGRTIDPRSGARKLDTYFPTWLEARLVKGRPLTPSTRTGYRNLYKRNIEPDLGGRALNKLYPETIRTWHAAVTAKAGSDQAAKSYRLLRAVLATAYADDIIKPNPCRIRGAGQENAAERPLVPTTMVLELAEAITPRYRSMVLLAGFGGLRTGECLGLHRSDLDLLHAEVKVVRQAQEVKGQGRVELPPKTEAGERVVALPKMVVEALNEHLTTIPGDPDSVLFLGPRNTPLRRATYSEAWRKAVAKVGAPDGLRAHDLRHHAATLAARTPNITTKELMARIGHASPAAALRYKHATAERDRVVASFLDEQIAAAVPEKKADVLRLATPERATGTEST